MSTADSEADQVAGALTALRDRITRDLPCLEQAWAQSEVCLGVGVPAGDEDDGFEVVDIATVAYRDDGRWDVATRCVLTVPGLDEVIAAVKAGAKVELRGQYARRSLALKQIDAAATAMGIAVTPPHGPQQPSAVGAFEVVALAVCAEIGRVLPNVQWRAVFSGARSDARGVVAYARRCEGHVRLRMLVGTNATTQLDGVGPDFEAAVAALRKTIVEGKRVPRLRAMAGRWLDLAQGLEAATVVAVPPPRPPRRRFPAGSRVRSALPLAFADLGTGFPDAWERRSGCVLVPAGALGVVQADDRRGVRTVRWDECGAHRAFNVGFDHIIEAAS